MDSGVKVTIYQPRKSAVTQGLGHNNKWKIRFLCSNSQYIYDLMQWTGTNYMNSELSLEFASKEEAIKFVSKKQWQYKVEGDYKKSIIKKSYADNFK